jgi:hypothetical protein
MNTAPAFRLLLAALAVSAGVFDARGSSSAVQAPARARPTQGVPGSTEGRKVIVVVSDGLRWQEVFRGADSALLFGRGKFWRRMPVSAQQKYWRATAAERQRALMPFLSGTVAREGVLIGNRDAGSAMRVTNGLNFSYPGYNETLTGIPDPRIDRNTYGPNPNLTVFEWLNRRAELRGRVGAVGAWETFEDIFNLERSGIFMHSARKEPLDARSHAAAMRYLDESHPAALFVAYVETDDHAHDNRYDRELDAAHAVDGYLAALWAAAQSHPDYRGRTTLIVTADHGRGRGSDWTTHGKNVPGSEETWLAMIGPDIPATGIVRSNTVFANAQVAATVAAALGLDFAAGSPRAAPPIGFGVRR